jgi:hypothetical protein
VDGRTHGRTTFLPDFGDKLFASIKRHRSLDMLSHIISFLFPIRAYYQWLSLICFVSWPNKTSQERPYPTHPKNTMAPSKIIAWERDACTTTNKACTCSSCKMCMSDDLTLKQTTTVDCCTSSCHLVRHSCGRGHLSVPLLGASPYNTLLPRPNC